VTLPYSIGSGVPQSNPALRDAIQAALADLQQAGIETALLNKWQLNAGSSEAPMLITH
jgi:polar amino acid transport system substrate-binding protein